jgi:BirA family biotin operon repressor/biotin-[acetyl-CoA-carboxylase] ligase
MERALELVRLLADGTCHSGEAIARRLGVSRAAVWKAVRRAREGLGVAVESVRGHGYRLRAPIDLLDVGHILAELARRGAPPLARIELHDQIDSTSARMMALAADGAPSGSLCLAERQTAGRGRRGRTWVSPFGAGIALSILWRTPYGPGALGGMSLAAGAAVSEVLAQAGVRKICLKWPNDLLWHGRKLGGLLLEVAGEAEGPSHLVLGVGINLRLPREATRTIDQPWTDLTEVLGEAEIPGRNALAAALIHGLWAALERYGREGLAPFRDRWAAFDCLRGQTLEVLLGDQVITGVHRGIAEDGALLLATAEGIRSFHGGEVSVRTTAGTEAP